MPAGGVLPGVPPPKRLMLTLDTVGTVARGHPWVYREGVIGSAGTGEPVELTDGKGKRVAWGLFEGGPIAVRVLGREPMPVERVVAWRLKDAFALRAALVPQLGTTNAYRVCHGEGDRLPGLVLDRYDQTFVLRLYARAWEPHLGSIVDALRGLGVTSLWRRFGVARVDDRQGGEALIGPEPPDTLVVEEHGVKLLARVKVGQKTGLFLDQREHRRMVRGWSAGRSVTNLFSYNGGFSVSAALGGATRVTTVDLAPAAIDDAVAIFRLNGVDPSSHAFEVADVFTWKGAAADLVVCDPPSLTHAKDADTAAKKAYRDLHRHILPMARSWLATSSCTARLAWDRWEEAVREGLGHPGPGEADTRWSRLYAGSEPADHPVGLSHPEGRYLKFMLLARR